MMNRSGDRFVVAGLTQDALAGGGSAATVARAGFASAFRTGRAVLGKMARSSVVGRRGAGASSVLGRAVITGFVPGALGVCVPTVRVLTADVVDELIAAIDKRFSKVCSEVGSTLRVAGNTMRFVPCAI